MFLGIDYGAKKIGLAIADAKDKIVLPLATLENKGRDFILTALRRLIAERQIKKIIVGWPLGLAGEKSRQTAETEKFVVFLKTNLTTEIVVFDERLTSRLADKLAGDRDADRDAGAAMVILENYLSSL